MLNCIFRLKYCIQLNRTLDLFTNVRLDQKQTEALGMIWILAQAKRDEQVQNMIISNEIRDTI